MQSNEPDNQNQRHCCKTAPAAGSELLKNSFSSSLRRHGFVRNPLTDPKNREIVEQLTDLTDQASARWDALRAVEMEKDRNRTRLQKLLSKISPDRMTAKDRRFVPQTTAVEALGGKLTPDLKERLTDLCQAGIVNIRKETVVVGGDFLDGAYASVFSNGLSATLRAKRLLQSEQQPDTVPQRYDREEARSRVELLFQK